MRSAHFIMTRILGWKITTDFPNLPKSITVFAPHTSYWDAILGKLVLLHYQVPHKFLSKKELFYFPMNIVMHLFGAIPVGGVKGHNAIHDATEILSHTENMHLVICPEGQLAPTDHWNPGFYYIAIKANVPMIVVFLDYGKREAGVKGVISDTQNLNDVYRKLADIYDGVTARHPDCFLLPKIKS